MTHVTSPKKSVNCWGLGAAEMSGIAERKRKPDSGGNDERLGFPNPTEASSVESQQGSGLWTGLSFGLRGTHGGNFHQQTFT